MRSGPAPGGYQPPQGQQPTGQAFGGANQAQNQLTSQQLMSTRLGQPQSLPQPPAGGPPMGPPQQGGRPRMPQNFGDMSGGYANFGGQMGRNGMNQPTQPMGGNRLQGPPPGGPPMAPQGGRGSTLGQAGAVGQVANNLMGNMRGAVGNWAGGSMQQSPPPLPQAPASGPKMAPPGPPRGGPPMQQQPNRAMRRAGALRGRMR